MITLDFTNMMTAQGLTPDDINSLKDRLKIIHEDITQRKTREFHFLDLPSENTEQISLMADNVKNTSDFFLLLGIGGSALGPKAILQALKPFYNLKHSPKIFIYDNVDPGTLTAILSIIDLKRTTVNVITKSGSTVETMASFLILMNALKEVHGEKFSKRIIATTDPEKGALREMSAKTGFRTLPVPPDVGGRYSVLSPVGLLSSSVAGINISGLLKGARDMLKKCSDADPWKNPAYMTASLMYLIDKKKGRNISVLLPYSDRLKTFSEWYCQLWAESLGKNGAGQTPYPSLGTTDQHSQLQLWIEGPADKVVTFIKIDDYGSDMLILKEDSGSMGYLKNHSLGELIKAEQEATELALQKAGVPNMRLNVPMIDAYYTGQIFLFFELVTAVTGLLYGINPFDQPAVEEGKNLTYGIMGRKGYEQKGNEVSNYRDRIQKSRYKI